MQTMWLIAMTGLLGCPAPEDESLWVAVVEPELGPSAGVPPVLVAELPISDDPTLSPRAAAARHGVHQVETFSQFTQRWRQHHAAGMRLIDLDVHESEAGTHYFGTFAPGTGRYALYRYSSEVAFLNRVDLQQADGFQLIDVEIAEVGGQTWYYGVWSGDNTAADPLTVTTSLDSFAQLLGRRTAAGDRLVDVEISNDGGKPRYWAVWTADRQAPEQQLITGTSLSDFGDAYEAARADGLRLQDLAVTNHEDGTVEFLGVADEGGGTWAYYVYFGWTDFLEQWAAQGEAGRSLRDLEVVDRPAGGRYYIGTWGAGPDDPTDRTDVPAMAADIQDALSGRVVGFAYAIADQSQLAIAGAGGLAQRAPDPAHLMTSKTYSTVASVTKHLTAVVLLALMEQNGLAPDDEILPYLPGSWNPHPSVAGLTFEHLLTHTTGIQQLLASTDVEGAGNDWDGLQVIVEEIGATPGAGRVYKNANFALMRILIPALWQELEEGAIPNVTEDNVRELYLDAMDAFTNERLGLPYITCETPEGEIQAYSYDQANDTQPGKSWGTTGSGCGGHANLHLTAQQLASFMAGIRYSHHLLSAESQGYMEAERAGFSGAPSVEGGTAYRHGGDYYSNGRETHTCVTRFPGGIDASIVLNSDSPRSACNVLRDAFNAATPEAGAR